MADFVEDFEVYPLIVALTGCLCLEITASGLPAVCQCSPMVGEVYTLDYGPDAMRAGQGNGQAWVRLVGGGPVFPTDTNAAPVITTARCATPFAYELEIGISRCEPQGITRNNIFTPPTADEQLTSLRQYTADMAAMKRAVLCCLPESLGEDYEIALGLYQPLPSMGGVGGGTWQVFVRRA